MQASWGQAGVSAGTWSVGLRCETRSSPEGNEGGLHQLMTRVAASRQHKLIFLWTRGSYPLKKVHTLCPFILWQKCISTVVSGMRQYLSHKGLLMGAQSKD